MLDDSGPSYLSLASRSHDGDSSVVVREHTTEARVSVGDRWGGGARLVGTIPLPGSENWTGFACVQRETRTSTTESGVSTRSACTDSIRIGISTRTRAVNEGAFSPRGDLLLVPSTERVSETAVSGAMSVCHQYRVHYDSIRNDHVKLECRPYVQRDRITRGVIHAFNLKTGGPSVALVTEAAEFYQIAMGDGSEEFTVKSRTRDVTRTLSWEVKDTVFPGVTSSTGTPGVLRPTVTSSGTDDCRAQFRDLRMGVQVAGGWPCGQYHSDFNFAPLRADSHAAMRTLAGVRPHRGTPRRALRPVGRLSAHR